MADLELVIYGDDDETELFSVGTAAAHPNPYLQYPDDLSTSEIDLARGRAHIGFGNLGIVDSQTGATKDVRWLTSQLGTAAGFSAINRRRCKLTQWPDTSVVVMEGVIGGSRLNDSFAGFTLPIADVRDRGVKFPVFTRATTSTVLPRGVLNGYGSWAGGLRQLIPPPTGIPANFLLGTAGSHQVGIFVLGGRSINRVFTDAIGEVVRPTASAAGAGVYRDVVVMWRAAGSMGAWNEIADIAAQDWYHPGQVGLLNVTRSVVVKYTDGFPSNISSADVITGIRVSNANGGTLPTNGQDVEVMLAYDGPPSEQYPLHIETTWGQFVTDLMDGAYSSRRDPATGAWGTPNPRLRYDATAYAAIDIPVRCRITEPRDDLREVLEELHAAIGAAPALNDSGEITPIRYALPDASVTLPQIDDSNCTAVAGWEHPTSNAITSVKVTYPRHYYVPPDTDPDGSRSSGDGVSSVDQVFTASATEDVLAVMGEQDVLEIDAWMFAALGGVDGSPLTGDVTDEAGAQLAHDRANQVLARFIYGGEVSFVRIGS